MKLVFFGKETLTASLRVLITSFSNKLLITIYLSTPSSQPIKLGDFYMNKKSLDDFWNLEMNLVLGSPPHALPWKFPPTNDAWSRQW